MDIVSVIGKEYRFLDSNRWLSQVLSGKGIWHACHEWDGRAHSGYYWRRTVLLYV